MMHGDGKSDRPVVPAKPPNEAEPETAEEAVEGRGLAKENLLGGNVHRTPCRVNTSSEPKRVRQAEKMNGRSHSHINCYGVKIQGKSRMRQFRKSGSVRGAIREDGPYRDRFNVRRVSSDRPNPPP